MDQKPVIVTSEKLLRAATATRRPCLLPVWFAWLAGRLQARGPAIPEADVPYIVWLHAKLAQFDAKAQQNLARALEYVDLRRPVLEQEIGRLQALPAGDEVSARRTKARLSALAKEHKELQALAAKAAELAAARHDQVAARLPPRIKAFEQGASRRRRATDLTRSV